jgi:hypothetical protein
LYDKLKEEYDDEEQAKADITLMMQRLIFQQIQEQSQTPHLHPAFIDLLDSLKEQDGVDASSLAQNSIHEVMQMTE